MRRTRCKGVLAQQPGPPTLARTRAQGRCQGSGAGHFPPEDGQVVAQLAEQRDARGFFLRWDQPRDREVRVWIWARRTSRLHNCHVSFKVNLSSYVNFNKG